MAEQLPARSFTPVDGGLNPPPLPPSTGVSLHLLIKANQTAAGRLNYLGCYASNRLGYLDHGLHFIHKKQHAYLMTIKPVSRFRKFRIEIMNRFTPGGSPDTPQSKKIAIIHVAAAAGDCRRPQPAGRRDKLVGVHLNAD